MNRERRAYTTEFKQAALQLITTQGLGLTEAARRLGIHPNLLRNWKDKAAGNGGIISPGPAQPTPIEVENARLRAENERLRMERDILKKATAFFAKESR